MRKKRVSEKDPNLAELLSEDVNDEKADKEIVEN